MIFSSESMPEYFVLLMPMKIQKPQKWKESKMIIEYDDMSIEINDNYKTRNDFFIDEFGEIENCFVDDVFFESIEKDDIDILCSKLESKLMNDSDFINILIREKQWNQLPF